MSQKPCPHPDIRKFNGIRCCLACGKAVFEASSSNPTLHTVDATGRYKHTRLNYELGREIRLISLLPGDSDDALRCEIAHVNLEDDPVYDAVSYTWATEDGDASLSSTIECIQGGLIPITRNCDIVLRQLRRPGIRRTLWVDAICIDQANISERNHQVGFMDLIYRGARCVLICISDRVRRATSPDYAQLFRCLQDTHLIADEALEMFDVTSLLHLLSLRYFGRGWVIQEVALARAAFLIVNGHELSLNSSVMDRLKRVCKRHRLELPGVMMWTPGHRFEYDVLACLYAGMRCNVSDPLDHVFAVLSLMEPQARSLISIDYSLSKESVYTTAIIAIMATRHNLDVILYVSQNKPYETHHGIGQCLTEENLRSYLSHASANDLGWVDPVKPRRLPQFDEDKTGPWQSTIEVKMMSSLEYHQHPLTLEGISCAIEITQPKLCCLLPRFSIRAHYLDNIEKPAAFAVDFELDQPGFPIQYKGALMSWGRTTHHTLAKYFQVDHPVSTAYPDMVSDKDVVKFQAARSLCTATSTENVRTVSADHDLYVEHLLGFFCALHRPFDIYAEDLVERIHVGGEYPHLNTEDLIEFFSTVIEHMLKNWVFSSHYSLGLGPRTMKKCDEIWAIDGANTPFVLRKTGTKQYKIVGPCYLWAALELDAWNPGTKKGRWGPDVERPTFEQTRMIEIH